MAEDDQRTMTVTSAMLREQVQLSSTKSSQSHSVTIGGCVQQSTSTSRLLATRVPRQRGNTSVKPTHTHTHTHTHTLHTHTHTRAQPPKRKSNGHNPVSFGRSCEACGGLAAWRPSPTTTQDNPNSASNDQSPFCDWCWPRCPPTSGNPPVGPTYLTASRRPQWPHLGRRRCRLSARSQRPPRCRRVRLPYKATKTKSGRTGQATLGAPIGLGRSNGQSKRHRSVP